MDPGRDDQDWSSYETIRQCVDRRLFPYAYYNKPQLPLCSKPLTISALLAHEG